MASIFWWVWREQSGWGFRRVLGYVRGLLGKQSEIVTVVVCDKIENEQST